MATRLIKYIGGQREGVFVPAFDADRDIKHGETVEMPAALAKSLAEQVDNWQLVEPPKKGSTEKGGES